MTEGEKCIHCAITLQSQRLSHASCLSMCYQVLACSRAQRWPQVAALQEARDGAKQPKMVFESRVQDSAGALMEARKEKVLQAQAASLPVARHLKTCIEAGVRSMASRTGIFRLAAEVSWNLPTLTSWWPCWRRDAMLSAASVGPLRLAAWQDALEYRDREARWPEGDTEPHFPARSQAAAFRKTLYEPAKRQLVQLSRLSGILSALQSFAFSTAGLLLFQNLWRGRLTVLVWVSLSPSANYADALSSVLRGVCPSQAVLRCKLLERQSSLGTCIAAGSGKFATAILGSRLYYPVSAVIRNPSSWLQLEL